MTKEQDSVTPPTPPLDFKSFIHLYQETNMSGLTIGTMSKLIVAWAEQTFPKGRNYKTAISKIMLEEMPEFLQEPSAEEWADVIIIWLDIAVLMGIDPEAAIMNKMSTNVDRTFVLDDESGLYHHQK